jgi:hypothetical protein
MTKQNLFLKENFTNKLCFSNVTVEKKDIFMRRKCHRKMAEDIEAKPHRK